MSVLGPTGRPYVTGRPWGATIGDPDVRGAMIQVVVSGVPAGSVLVRVAISGGTFSLPRAPVRGAVTATVGIGTPSDLVTSVSRSGYRLAGETTGARAGIVDLLVSPDLRDTEPGWWGELTQRAERVFDLRMGPVAHLLDDELALHAAALGR